jgi:hypothetical protein
LVGFSPIPNQTQNGPITISNNIIKLTIAEDVYRGAILKQANEMGRIITPIATRVHTGAVNKFS